MSLIDSRCIHWRWLTTCFARSAEYSADCGWPPSCFYASGLTTASRLSEVTAQCSIYFLLFEGYGRGRWLLLWANKQTNISVTGRCLLLWANKQTNISVTSWLEVPVCTAIELQCFPSLVGDGEKEGVLLLFLPALLLDLLVDMLGQLAVLGAVTALVFLKSKGPGNMYIF